MSVEITVPQRYVPKHLNAFDRKKQFAAINRSRKMYKKGKYYVRPKVNSFKSKKSHHVNNAKKMYRVSTVFPNKELAKRTGCSLSALEEIVRKGEGAYFSSGSRPNQTPHSWGISRLASAITGGKASLVDYHILETGCNKKNSKALKLAHTLKKQKETKKK